MATFFFPLWINLAGIKEWVELYSSSGLVSIIDLRKQPLRNELPDFRPLLIDRFRTIQHLVNVPIVKHPNGIRWGAGRAISPGCS